MGEKRHSIVAQQYGNGEAPVHKERPPHHWCDGPQVVPIWLGTPSQAGSPPAFRSETRSFWRCPGPSGSPAGYDAGAPAVRTVVPAPCAPWPGGSLVSRRTDSTSSRCTRPSGIFQHTGLRGRTKRRRCPFNEGAPPTAFGGGLIQGRRGVAPGMSYAVTLPSRLSQYPLV